MEQVHRKGHGRSKGGSTVPENSELLSEWKDTTADVVRLFQKCSIDKTRTHKVQREKIEGELKGKRGLLKALGELQHDFNAQP